MYVSDGNKGGHHVPGTRAGSLKPCSWHQLIIGSLKPSHICDDLNYEFFKDSTSSAAPVKKLHISDADRNVTKRIQLQLIKSIQCIRILGFLTYSELDTPVIARNS